VIADQDVLSRYRLYMDGSQNPDFLGYKEQALTRDKSPDDRFVWDMKRICRLGNFYNSTVLDVGAGCGWLSYAISQFGNNKVIANDILPSMVDGIRDAVAFMKAQGHECNITPMLGDVCDLDIPDGSIDGIMSLESIEHVHDIDKMFDKCAALLRSGGRILIANDSNILARNLRDETVEMWHKRENDTAWSDYLRSLRPIEHGDARPFRTMREEIVRAANPSLGDDAVNAIVEATPGLLRAEIERIALGYPNVSLPQRNDFDWCRNPETGEYAERLLNPFELASKLEARGMKARVLHSFRRFPLVLFNAVPFRPVNEALFNLRPAFYVVAEKT
jgi:SAM-dependent methyltransferase